MCIHTKVNKRRCSPNNEGLGKVGACDCLKNKWPSISILKIGFQIGW